MSSDASNIKYNVLVQFSLSSLTHTPNDHCEKYSACPNNRGGIVELSEAGNPKNFNHI